VEALQQGRGSMPVGIAFDRDAHGPTAGAPAPANRGDLDLARLSEGIGVPVHVDRTAAAAAWAEHLFGALVGQDDCLMIIVGTRISGCLILAGRLVRGAHGLGGRIGHMPLVPGGLACPCGLRGCLDQYASGAALVDRTQRVVEDTAPRGGKGDRLAEVPTQLTSADIIQAALAGDGQAVEQIAAVGNHLGEGLARLVSAFDVSTIALGGPLTTSGELYLGPTREALSRQGLQHDWMRAVELRPALLGDDAALVGAAELARRQIDEG